MCIPCYLYVDPILKGKITSYGEQLVVVPEPRGGARSGAGTGPTGCSEAQGVAGEVGLRRGKKTNAFWLVK